MFRRNRRSCSICADEKVAKEENFPAVCATCTHQPDVCITCVRKHLREEVNGKSRTEVKCPHDGCDKVLCDEDVRRLNLSTLADRMEYLKVLKFLQSLANFCWCSSPGCGSGQEVVGGADNPIMCCHKCKEKTCFVHRCVWHEGYTCAEYDVYTSTLNQTDATVEWVTRNSKPCPKCGIAIEKNEGCDHMTCTNTGCAAEFCWLCLADYNGERGIWSIGNSAHRRTCQYYAPNPEEEEEEE